MLIYFVYIPTGGQLLMSQMSQIRYFRHRIVPHQRPFPVRSRMIVETLIPPETTLRFPPEVLDPFQGYDNRPAPQRQRLSGINDMSQRVTSEAVGLPRTTTLGLWIFLGTHRIQHLTSEIYITSMPPDPFVRALDIIQRSLSSSSRFLPREEKFGGREHARPTRG